MKKIGTFFRRGGAFLLTLCLLAAGLDAALTRSKVKVSLYRSRNRLRESLKKEGYDP